MRKHYAGTKVFQERSEVGIIKHHEGAKVFQERSEVGIRKHCEGTKVFQERSWRCAKGVWWNIM